MSTLEPVLRKDIEPKEYVFMDGLTQLVVLI